MHARLKVVRGGKSSLSVGIHSVRKFMKLSARLHNMSESMATRSYRELGGKSVHHVYYRQCHAKKGIRKGKRVENRDPPIHLCPTKVGEQFCFVLQHTCIIRTDGEDIYA